MPANRNCHVYQVGPSVAAGIYAQRGDSGRFPRRGSIPRVIAWRCPCASRACDCRGANASARPAKHLSTRAKYGDLCERPFCHHGQRDDAPEHGEQEADRQSQHHNVDDGSSLKMHRWLLSVTRPLNDRRSNALVPGCRSSGPHAREPEKPAPRKTHASPHASARGVGCVGWDRPTRVGLPSRRRHRGKKCTWQGVR
jgi:hypothetical protein